MSGLKALKTALARIILHILGVQVGVKRILPKLRVLLLHVGTSMLTICLACPHANRGHRKSQADADLEVDKPSTLSPVYAVKEL